MKKISMSILALSTALTAGAAFAYSCPTDMKAIDKAMSGSPLSMAEMDEVKVLRALGEKLHRSGDHDGSVEALEEARDLLGI